MSERIRRLVRLRPINLICLFLPVFILGGCASYQVGQIVHDMQVEWDDETTVMAFENSHVKIVLNNGDIFKGRILEISEHSLTLGGRENYGGGELEISLQDIDVIYVRTQEDKEIEIIWLVSVGLTIAAGTVYLLSNYGWN